MGFELTIDRTRLEAVTRGLGMRLLRRRAERIAALARVYAAPHGSISEGIVVEQAGPTSYKILSTNEHTLLVHNGSRPHRIFPRARTTRTGRPPMLRFEIGGRVVYARMVNHPGYKGDPFLTRALRDAS